MFVFCFSRAEVGFCHLQQRTFGTKENMEKQNFSQVRGQTHLRPRTFADIPSILCHINVFF